MTALPKTTAILNAGLTEGLHIGAQLHALIDGQPVADLAFGHARIPPPEPSPIPMAPDTLLLWLSAGKPITAVAIAMLVEQNKLKFDDEVATIIPEFAANGKDKITVRHLLTHTAGIRGMDLAYPFATWDETLAKIYAMKIERDWTPGLKAGYHAHTSWYLLGELINRLTHTPHDHWIRDHILQPLGMLDTWLAMSREQYHAYGPRIGYLYDTSTAQDSALGGGSTQHSPKPIPNYDTQLAASRPRPAASVRGPAHDMTRFYEMLRNGGTLNNTRLLSADMVHALTSRQRLGMFDHTFRQTLDWGLGIILNSSHYGPGIPYQFGPLASASTFGHGGSQSSSAFCDPERNLVVALVFNGCPGEPAHDRRLRATLKALYEDLGLA